MNPDLASPTASDWRVPHVTAPVSAVVTVPGSKSMTNRALLLAALADGPTLIAGPLRARDTSLMTGALRALGCVIDDASDPWRVTRPLPGPGGPAGPAGPRGAGRRDIEIDLGNAGTVLRFVPPVAALTTADVRFTGDPRISQRPVGPLLAALRELGALVDDGGTGAVPFVVHGQGRVPGGAVTIDASASSQLVSGLLLAAARFDRGVRITHAGPPVPSAPHISMTVRMLRARGVDVRTGDEDEWAGQGTGQGSTVTHRWRVSPGPISGGRIDIEPDLSNALPFVAAALATGGEVTVAGWPAASLQPAARIIDLITAMGATVRQVTGGLRVTGAGRISGLRADLSEVGELTPVLTALAALADEPSELTGIGHLRTHETDRLAALAGEIGKLGGDVTELDDGLRIRPRPLSADGVVFDSHDDHRLVMAAAVLGLVTPGLRVHNAETAAKTFPGFGDLWTRTVAPAR